MAITVFIRYEVEPHLIHEFEAYARCWLEIVPRCGGELVGYWLPHEGRNFEAYGLVSFANLAAYEDYRARLRTDEAGAANFHFAREGRFIRIEERTFLRRLE